jgi:hypothetical protein
MTEAFLDETETPMEDSDEEPKGQIVGLCSAVVVAALIEPYTTKESQKQGTKITLTFQLHPTDIINAENAGRKKITWLYWVEGGEWRVREAWKALDLPYDEHETKKYKNGNPLRIYKVSQANLVGRSCLIDCVLYTGKKYSEVDSYSEYDDGPRKQLSIDELHEMFPPEDKGHSVSEEKTDDDLPF